MTLRGDSASPEPGTRAQKPRWDPAQLRDHHPISASLYAPVDSLYRQLPRCLLTLPECPSLLS